MSTSTMQPAAHATAPTRTAPRVAPRWAGWAIAGALAVAVLGTASVRFGGQDIREPDARAVAVRPLVFADRADGAIAVVDPATGRELGALVGQAGFARGALRALMRERRLRGLGPEAPFELLGRADGRLTLHDPSTGQRLDLESFGPTNAAVFARWLAPSSASAGTPGPAGAAR